ncbi:MAG: hypothetical protein PHY93_02710 [Bacteriovorax sp.]|nr:hypothetical protein [Bacteriovorax sp.]
MKKFIVALMVLTSLVSCGKNNTVGNAGALTVATSPISTINSDSGFQALASAITNNNFNAQNSNYYTEFHYGSLINTCVTKDGWFGIDYQSCSSSISSETMQIYGKIILDTKKAELNAILSKTVVFRQWSSTLFTLRTTDNYTYTIRTDLPIQANPVYNLNNVDGKAVQLISIK